MQISGSEEGTKGADCRDIGTDKTEFVLILAVVQFAPNSKNPRVNHG